MTSNIPTLEALAERLESGTRSTIAALESQAKLENELVLHRRQYEGHKRFIEAGIDNSGEITGGTAAERAARRERLVLEDEVTIRYLEKILGHESLLARTKADIEGYRIERGTLQSLLRIREMADTAERAQGRYRRERRAWKRSR